jgi:hypothetical protein
MDAGTPLDAHGNKAENGEKSGDSRHKPRVVVVYNPALIRARRSIAQPSSPHHGDIFGEFSPLHRVQAASWRRHDS